MSKNVCAVMVTYNRLESLKTALANYFDQSVKPTALIIVDNNSSDGTKEYLNSIRDDRNIICLFSPTNVGAGGGLSQAMSYALKHMNPDYIWMIEDDTYYKKEALADLLRYIETSSYDMISLKGFKYNFGSTLTVVGNDKLQPIPFALLDGSLIKAEIIRKIGPPKKEYFMMCDDYEFSLRMKKNGYKIGLINIESADYLHLGGDGKFTSSTLWRGYYSSRNHLLILREYFSIRDLLSYLYKQSKFLIAAALFAPDRKKRVKYRLLGIWHGILGKQGKTLDPATLKFLKTK
jgi:GT2 family glycosyltransferase